MSAQKKLLNHCCNNHKKIRFYFGPTETARHWQTPGSWWGMPESIIFWVHQKKGETFFKIQKIFKKTKPERPTVQKTL